MLGMIEREITTELLESAKEYPVVTIVGPRQSGKTTLAKLTFKDYRYCSLEDPDIRAYAESDPRSFLKEYDGFVILDEIQRVPSLLSYIQTLVDENKTKGRFILTGSHQLRLRADISQSLAGRTAILHLLPLSISELAKAKALPEKEKLLIRGFFPRIYDEDINPTRAYASYYQTYVERDVRQLINLKDVSLFEKFLKLLAGRAGQVVNLNSLSNDVGASSTTLKEWLSILEASFIVFKLPPFFENFGKRVVKSPKYYFTDVGLLCYLLGIENEKQVGRDPLIGNIFENMVVLEFLKQKYNRGKMPNLYFFRDSNGNEIDLIYQEGRELIPVEIKYSATFNQKFTKGILKFQSFTELAGQGVLVYSGDFTPKSKQVITLNYKNIESLFND